MKILTILNDYGLFNFAVICGIVILMSRLRKLFLDNLLEKIKEKNKWILLSLSALLVSFLLTFLVELNNNYEVLLWLRKSVLNWIFSWVFHDIIKNLFKVNEDV